MRPARHRAQTARRRGSPPPRQPRPDSRTQQLQGQAVQPSVPYLSRLEVIRVGHRKAGPFPGELLFGENRVNGAGLDARVAVDALVGIDIELLCGVVARLVRRGMDAVDRAHLDAGVVLDANAWFGDHIGHGSSLWRGEAA